MRYYVERFARAVLTVWAALTITFAMIRLMPGGPISQIRARLTQQGMEPAAIDRTLEGYRARMNLNPDAPMHQQYIEYVLSMAQGDLGTALEYTNDQGDPQAISSLVAEFLPWSVFVMTVATFLIFAIAIVWGAFVAYKEGGYFDKVSSSVAILMGAIPFYVLAFILLIVLAYNNPVFPTGGKMTALTEPSLSVDFVLDALHHATLPIASLVLVQTGLQMLAMRGNSIQVLGEDYVRVARLRGLSDRRISTRYVARNAILPMYTGFLTLIAFNLGGSVILEEVFRYRGIGWIMFDALEIRDYSVLMGVFLVLTIALVASVLIADLTYSMIDPRVKTGDSSEAY